MRIRTLAVAALACALVACDSLPPVGPVGGGTSEVAAVAVDPSSVTLSVGGTTRLTAVPKDANGNSVTTSSVKWTSSDTSIALVSDSGVVTARKPGTSTIQAKAGGTDGSAVIVVSQGPVASVTVLLSVSALLVNQWTLATAQLKDANGAIVADRAVAWVSSNPSVATVSDSGLVTGIAAGPVTITAVSEGVNGSSSLTVTDGPVPGIPVYPGESIQAKVNAEPAGTTFIIKAGRHTRQSVTPKDGNAFIGEPGAVLDGQGAAIRAFTGSADNVVIKGLVIENYAPGSQKHAVYGATSVGWVVEGNEFRYNDGGGLHIGKGMRVLRNVFHHNAQVGLGGNGDSVVVEGNEIAFNNYQKAYDYNWEAGGAKFVRTRWLTLRNNYAHDNWGHGLWIDIDCLTTLIESNRVENNAATGIFVEISFGAVVRNNTGKGNGFNETWINGAGIEVNSSPDVEIYGNTLSGNRNGIVAIEGSRGTGAYGARIVQNLHVHDNSVDVSVNGVSGIGIYGSGTPTDVFSSARNNRFVHNTYWLGSNDRPFTWKDGKVTDEAWRGLGMDVTGTFNR
jgi:nitrous oxidase accessory protein NosD